MNDHQHTTRDLIALYHAAAESGEPLDLPVVEEPRCPHCDGALMLIGILPDGSTKPVICLRCDEGRALYQQRQQRIFRASGLSDEYQGFSFDAWETALTDEEKRGKRTAFRAARLFVERVIAQGQSFTRADIYAALGRPFPGGRDRARKAIVFHGDFGVGKTGMAACIVNASLPFTVPLFTRVDSFFLSIRASYSDHNTMSEAEQITLAVESPLLVFDELTKRNGAPSPFQLDKMEQVLRTRLIKDNPTVITTNHTLEQMREVWGDGIAEILTERAHWIPIEGVNLRNKDQFDPEDVI